MGLRACARPIVAIGIGYLAGAVPFSNLVAGRTKGVDLREVGTGTVSGSGLYYEAGLGPLLVGGILDVAKGTTGPLVAGSASPMLAALAGGTAVIGHNWSIFLGGAGGRGISPAMGALLVNGWQGSLVLLGGVTVGRMARLTSVGAFSSYLALIPVLAAKCGRRGATAGVAVVLPILAKRIAGNQPAEGAKLWKTRLIRLVFDQDSPPPIEWARRKPGSSG